MHAGLLYVYIEYEYSVRTLYIAPVFDPRVRSCKISGPVSGWIAVTLRLKDTRRASAAATPLSDLSVCSYNLPRDQNKIKVSEKAETKTVLYPQKGKNLR